MLVTRSVERMGTRGASERMALSHINSLCFGFRCGNLMGNQEASPQNPRDRDISASLKCEGQVRLRWPHKDFLLRWDPVSLQAMHVSALRSSANSECELPRRASTESFFHVLQSLSACVDPGGSCPRQSRLPE